MQTENSPKPTVEVLPKVDPDVVVVFADEIEYHRFVERQGAYDGESRRPSTLVFAQDGHTDLTKKDQRALLRETLSNRSIWMRNPNPTASKDVFVCAVKGAKDRGGLLFAEIYNSELQLRAQRLHAAFLALGLRSWHIEVEEKSSEAKNSDKKGKVNSAASAKIIGANAKGNIERELAEKFERTLRQNIDVEFNTNCRTKIDPKVESKIKKLGLENDPVVSAVLLSRNRDTPVKAIDQKLDFSFLGEIERKFDLAFRVATKILFVSAHLAGEYQSFDKAVQKIKNCVRIHVED
jgi:hypothetical protein